MKLLKETKEEKIVVERKIEPNHETIKDIAVELLKQQYHMLEFNRHAEHNFSFSIEHTTELTILVGEYKVTIEAKEFNS